LYTNEQKETNDAYRKNYLKNVAEMHTRFTAYEEVAKM